MSAYSQRATNSVMSFSVAGVSFRKHYVRQVMDVSEGTEVKLVPEPDNRYDSGAVKVVVRGVHVGYVPKILNKSVDLEGSYVLDAIGKFHSGVYVRVRRM